jgi:hypothetical protein
MNIWLDLLELIASIDVVSAVGILLLIEILRPKKGH